MRLNIARIPHFLLKPEPDPLLIIPDTMRISSLFHKLTKIPDRGSIVES